MFSEYYRMKILNNAKEIILEPLIKLFFCVCAMTLHFNFEYLVY